MTAGQASRDRMLARLAAYAVLRDDGALPVDAARDMHLSQTTAARYERWYRGQAGLPPRPPGYGQGLPRPGVFRQ